MCGIHVSAQNELSVSTIDRIEKLLSHHEIEAADSLLRKEYLSFGEANSAYQADCIVGLLFYYQEKFEESISVMSIAISKMDSLRLWDCEHYLKTAYYIADSYIHLNKLRESETVINYSLVKCVNSYSNCIYAKKLYQLLLVIYDKVGISPAVIEQVHNEIQKIAINIYASDALNKDGEQTKEGFMFFYDYITKPTISKEDSMNMNQGKAAYLYSIGEYEEAIRLDEKVKAKLTQYDPKLHGINESLLVMYSSMAQKDKIDKLLPEMYEYSLQMKLDYDPYMLNCWVGHNLNQYRHYRMAQYYFEQSDSFLNMNKSKQDWLEKKKNVLSKMIYNCRSLAEYEKVIEYCKEYAMYTDKKDYDDYFFVNYNQGLALRALEKYTEAIEILELLKKYIQSCRNVNHEDYVMTNCILGVCYIKNNQNDDAIECTSMSIELYKSLEMNNKSLLGSLYNNIGKAYLQKEKYQKALPFLKLSADIQIEQNGVVTPNTQSYINECKRRLK
jgi:tetratricopeptide (TPR) repeat protein